MLSESARMTVTPGRLRAESSSCSSLPASTTRTRPLSLERCRGSRRSSRVLISSMARSLHDLDGAVAELGRQRADEREALHALGQALLVAARVRAEDHAAAGVVRAREREPWRARPVPFWRYGLRAAAADLAAGLGVGGAGAATGQLGDDGLVHDGRVDGRREERLGQVDRCRPRRRSCRTGWWWAWLRPS